MKREKVNQRSEEGRDGRRGAKAGSHNPCSWVRVGTASNPYPLNHHYDCTQTRCNSIQWKSFQLFDFFFVNTSRPKNFKPKSEKQRIWATVCHTYEPTPKPEQNTFLYGIFSNRLQELNILEVGRISLYSGEIF